MAASTASTKSSSTGSDHPILLIDGECVLCNRFAQFIIRHDPTAIFRFAALDSATATELLAGRDLPPAPSGTVVLLEGSNAYYRSDASLRVLGKLGLPWSLTAFALWIPRRIRDACYDLVARNRIRLYGRTTSCGLLTPHERARFLSD